MIEPPTTEQDTVTQVQQELEEYLEEQALVITSDKSFEELQVATQNILSHARFLLQQKEVLTKSEYKKLLKLHGWKGEEKKYLKVATAFKEFSPEKLAPIEPATIFRLANNSKKYQPVIEKLQNLTEINQATVRELMATAPARTGQEPEKPSIWRRTKDGRRYCQIPPIHDEKIGTMLQRMIDEEGSTAQFIIGDALSLREAYKSGRLILVESAVETPCDGGNEPASTTPDSTEVDSTQELTDVDSALVLETQVETPLVVELSNDALNLVVASQLVETQPAQIDDVGNSGCVQYLDWPETEDEQHLDAWSFEPEPEKEGEFEEEEQRSNPLSPAPQHPNTPASSSPAPQHPSTPASSSQAPPLPLALTPVEFLVEEMQRATSWEEIREALQLHGDYKQQAWEALTPNEKKRVMALMPEDIQKLSRSKKAGIIADFKEIREGLYQVRLPDNLFWETVSSERLDRFLSAIGH